MARMTVLLGLLGLSTRGELQRAMARKSRWHGLVRDIFAQYYLKFQELAIGYMPDLPRRWSTDWETSIRQELDEFRKLDLQSVAALLDTCGFGTERWERIKKAGFPALQRLIEEEILSGNGRPGGNGNGELWTDRVEAAVGEDLQHLMAWHPDAFIDLIRKIDLDSGQLVLSEDELQASEAFLEMRQRLVDAELVIRKLRTGGRRALDHIKELEAQVTVLRKARDRRSETGEGSLPADLGPRAGVADRNGGDGYDGDPAVVEMAREIEELEGRLASRDRTVAGLEEQAAELEARLAAAAARAVHGNGAELLEEEDTPSGDPAVVELANEIRDLESRLKARDHTIEGLREQLARYEAHPGRAAGDRSPAAPGDLDGGAAAEVKRLTTQLKVSEHDAEALREEIERLSKLSEKTRVSRETEDAGVQLQLQQARNEVRIREHTIDGLEERLAKLQGELDAALNASARERAKAAGDLNLARENEALRRDVRAREETIRTLRGQVDKFENELNQAREQLVSEVQKLAAITSGEVELKPSEELSQMDADQLLGYARDVAEDLDVRRQTLTEGLQGIDSIKGSFDESRRLYEEQQRELQEKLEQMQAQMEEYEQQQQPAQEAEAAVGSAEAREVIAKQRQQLDLLSTRIKQLTSSKNELDQNNKKIYADLEAAVRRVIPLRRQIEELENLQEALQRYIRQKHDRTFTVSKLKE
ncbi:MAG: hypothetical protein ABIL09_04510 [Gemmatimonadota bacterium]